MIILHLFEHLFTLKYWMCKCLIYMHYLCFINHAAGGDYKVGLGDWGLWCDGGTYVQAGGSSDVQIGGFDVIGVSDVKGVFLCKLMWSGDFDVMGVFWSEVICCLFIHLHSYQLFSLWIFVKYAVWSL